MIVACVRHVLHQITGLAPRAVAIDCWSLRQKGKNFAKRATSRGTLSALPVTARCLRAEVMSVRPVIGVGRAGNG